MQHRTAFIECQAAFEEAVAKRQQLATQRGILEEESGLEDLSTWVRRLGYAACTRTDGDPSIRMTQDLLLNLMPALPFGEASGPLVAAMYSGRLKRSDLEVCWLWLIVVDCG